jgi:hypothetical protein
MGWSRLEYQTLPPQLAAVCTAPSAAITATVQVKLYSIAIRSNPFIGTRESSATSDFTGHSSHLNLSSAFPPIKTESQTSQLHCTSQLGASSMMGAIEFPHPIVVCRFISNRTFCTIEWFF